MNNMQISQVVCTRISHDIVGNVGAVANALELFEDDDNDFFEDIKKILGVSSRVLAARMKFFRMAFGLENAALKNSETVFASITDYLRTLSGEAGKISFEAENIMPEHNRILMQAVMMIADLMPYGGQIKCCYENERLWVAANCARGYSQDKISAVKSIISGSKDFDADAQYAHILSLMEETKDENKMKLMTIDGPALVIGKNL